MIDLATYPTTAAERSAQWHHEAIALYRAARACDAVAQSVAYPHGAGWLADVLDAEDAARASHPAVSL